MQTPSTQALKRFATGQSNPEEAAFVAEWLAGQPDAARAFEAYADDDTLLCNLKNAATIDTTISSDVQSVINKLLQVNIASESPAGATDHVVPDRLNEFRILRVIGRGGMGLVCEAFDERLNRKVAIKLMRDSLLIDTAHNRRFLREAQAAAAIEHEGIVPILSAGEADGVSYLVMPLLQGETLADRLESGPLSPTELMQLAVEMSEALAAAHAAGIIHRDLKPSNIWLSKRTNEAQVRARLLDFGLARSFEANDGLTQTNQMIGTPSYMAPEQAQGKIADARTDIFSLGCVLYEAAVGKRAFDGKSILEILSQIANMTPPPIAKRCPNLAPEFSDMVQAMLAKAPEHRPQTMQELVKTTNRIRAQHLSPLNAAQPVILPQASNRFGGWSGRSKLVALGAMGFAFAAALLGVLITIRHPDGTETTIQSDGNVTVTVQPTEKIEVTRSEPQSRDVPLISNVTKDRDLPNVSSVDSSNAGVGWSERTSLEKLLEIGAKVRIGYANGNEYDATRTEDLVDNASIISVYAEANPQLTDDFFASYVVPLQQLQQLDVSRVPKLSDAARFFEGIGKLKRLMTLRASLPMDDKGCEHLSHCSELTRLDSVSPEFTESGARHLRKLERLVQFRFVDGVVSDEALVPLLELPYLSTIAIINTNLEGRFLSGDAPLPGINEIDLSGCRFSEEPLRFFNRFPNLQTIQMEGFESTGKSLVHLPTLGQLRLVNLRGSAIRDLEGLRALGRMPRLHSLSLHAARFIGDDQVKALVSGNPKELAYLDLGYTQVTDASVDALLTLPRLQSLTLLGVEISDEGYSKLASSKTLTYLTIGSKTLTRETIRALADRETPWEWIWILDCQLADDSIEEFAKFKDLRGLRLIGSRISPEGMERLQKLLPQTAINQ